MDDQLAIYAIVFSTPALLILVGASITLYVQYLQQWISRIGDNHRGLSERVGNLEHRSQRINDLMEAEAAQRDGFVELPADESEEIEEEESEQPEPEPQTVRFDDESDGLPMPVMLRALNLANSENDSEGIEAVQTAMAKGGRELFVNTSSVLQKLASIGILTDELVPDFAPPNIWRAHAFGRADQFARSLGGFERETHYLPRVARLLADDEPFRETSQAMVRQVRKLLESLVAVASDEEILTAVNSRSIRAFVLLGLAIQQM